jgi:hypothetical protein
VVKSQRFMRSFLSILQRPRSRQSIDETLAWRPSPASI